MSETFRPPQGVRDEAKKALGWIADGHAGSGFTSTGKARASQLAQGEPVSAETILRMYSFFSRHEVDKKAEGFNSGEDGFPSAGRVAWSAWGGDAGFTWSTKIRNQISERSIVLDLEEGQPMTEERLNAPLGTQQVPDDADYGDVEKNMMKMGAADPSSDPESNISDQVMAIDAANDQVQALLKTIMDSDPVAAQAYYLSCAIDLALSAMMSANGGDDADDDDDAMVMPADDASADMSMMSAYSEDRASNARLGVGTFVSWNSAGGRAKGKIVKVVTKGPLSSSDGFEIEGTSDHPAYSIRIYHKDGNGYSPSDTTVVHRGESLTVIQALPAPRSEDMTMIEERKSAMATAERMTLNTEIRAMATDDGSMKIAGYAAMFNKESTGLNFREVIAPGAFTRSLATGDPVYLLVNHDTESLPLASTQSGTLVVREDNQGLYIEATLDPANPRAVELNSVLARGDVDKMSFAFTVADGGETRDGEVRTLTDLNLFECSVVTWPAYDSTSVAKRSTEQEAIDLALRARFAKAKLTNLRLRK